MVALGTRLAVALVGMFLALSLLWVFYDSGPLSSSPNLVLTEESSVGAVRVQGDQRGTAVAEASQQTVAELVSRGGLERSYLSVMLPTGSGWVDPAQVQALEEWAEGDIALVSQRYSAAPSAVVYLLRPELARNSARSLFAELDQVLEPLSPGQRPTVIVHGLSLGASAGREVLAETEFQNFAQVKLWQGIPSGFRQPDPEDKCLRVSLNQDDPVAALGPGLLMDPDALDVLRSLPGSDSRPPGQGHRYLPVLPPEECILES